MLGNCLMHLAALISLADHRLIVYAWHAVKAEILDLRTSAANSALISSESNMPLYMMRPCPRRNKSSKAKCRYSLHSDS